MKENICRGCLRKECDYSTTGCPSYQDSLLLNTEGGDVSTEERVNNFLDSLIDRTVQATEKRIVERIEKLRLGVCDCTGANYDCEHWGYTRAIDDIIYIIDARFKSVVNLITNNK